MSTNDVPGANPGNADSLAAGAWAEHADGSLIFVKGNEGGRVYFEMYDTSKTPPVVYTDAMLEADFKRQFSVPPVGTSRVRWTWHDKTPFPWSRVVQQTQPRPGYASAEDQITAAQRVAESLHMRGERLREEAVRANVEEPARKAHAVIDKIAAALKDVFDG